MDHRRHPSTSTVVNGIHQPDPCPLSSLPATLRPGASAAVTTLAVVEAGGAVDGAVDGGRVGLAEGAGEVGARVGAALGGDVGGGVGGDVGDSVGAVDGEPEPVLQVPGKKGGQKTSGGCG